MGTGRTFELRYFNKKIEILHPYRTAYIPDILLIVRGHDMDEEIEYLFKRSNKELDNHIVFKIEDCPLWFWYTDNELRIGTKVVESTY